MKKIRLIGNVPDYDNNYYQLSVECEINNIIVNGKLKFNIICFDYNIKVTDFIFRENFDIFLNYLTNTTNYKVINDRIVFNTIFFLQPNLDDYSINENDNIDVNNTTLDEVPFIINGVLNLDN